MLYYRKSKGNNYFVYTYTGMIEKKKIHSIYKHQKN